MKLNNIIIIIITIIIIFFVISFTLFNYFLTNQNGNNTANIDESKNKLAVLVKKDGVFDSIQIIEKLNVFLDAVKSDLNLDNVGVFQAPATSLDILDEFVENLYYQENVGYIIMIGNDLAWDNDHWKNINPDIETAFLYVNDELCYLEPREPDQQGKPSGSSDYKDIAISWIFAPDICDSNKTIDQINEIKKDIVEDIISTYTSYHNNPKEILNKFIQSCLYIYDQNSLNTFYEREFNNRYQFDWTLVMNTDYEKIEEELQKNHLISTYRVHGTKTVLMINQSESEAFTSVDDYQEFIKNNDLPSLFIDAGACESSVFQRDCSSTSSGVQYCWPQVNICNGVWAYYTSISSPACKEVSSTSTFIGYVLRHHQTSTIVFGDITAHLI